MVGIERTFAQDTSRLVGKGKSRAIRRRTKRGCVLLTGAQGVNGKKKEANGDVPRKETEQRKSIVHLLIEKWGRFMGYR